MSGGGWRELALTVGYSGHMPFASGSWGSLAATLLFCGLLAACHALSITASVRDLLVVGAVLTATLLCGVLGDWAISRWGSKDPKPVVLDEFAGQWLSFVALPPALGDDGWRLAAYLAGQFFLFRVMDVWKPPPARRLEHLPGGWGIVTDDLMAGVYAALVGQLFWRLMA